MRLTCLSIAVLELWTSPLIKAFILWYNTDVSAVGKVNISRNARNIVKKKFVFLLMSISFPYDGGKLIA